MDVRHILIFVSSVAIVSYYAAIVYIWCNAADTSADLSYPSGFITLIGGTLATHLGAVFGLNRSNARIGAPRIKLGILESIAAWAYLISLALAAVLWGLEGFDENYAEGIRNLALTFPGVIAGVLAVAVNATTDVPSQNNGDG